MSALVYTSKAAQLKGLASIRLIFQLKPVQQQLWLILDTALEKISGELSMAGAFHNRIEHSMSISTLVAKSSKIALGRIMDADMAAESTNLSKTQVLSKANTAMLAQANQSMGNILTLFS